MATDLDFVPMPELPQHRLLHMSLAEWIKTLQNRWPVVHKALEEVREVYKKQADKKSLE